ncbi:response regulator transcription factor [Compostibacter hankyongensis]|uniref:Response regulator transcription factor n=1 Tax=Compostibacter hankyongensis TaxID=1007089 RepID=A0ABP8FKP3_9BACT
MRNMAVIEDNTGIRKTLSDFFGAEPGFSILFSCNSFEEFRDRWSDERLDIVLCDIGLPGKSGIEAAWYIKDRSPHTQVMMLTVFEEKEKIFQSLCAGASGYLLKSAPLADIRSGIIDILDGGAAMSPKIAKQVIGFFSRSPRMTGNAEAASKLTSREIEILSFLEAGCPNREIAEKMFVSVDTVKYHIKNIYLKLHVGSRAELIARYRNHL